MTETGGASLPLWSALSPEEKADALTTDPVVVLPLAATEQHGPHLPLSTDVDIGVGLLTEAFRRLPEGLRAWTLPPVTVGASQEHARFPGTRSASAEELVQSIVASGASLADAGVRRLVLSNSHGGNRYAMEAAGLILRTERDMLVVKASWPRFPRPEDVTLPEAEWRHGLHGGALETAMMLHLHPQLVRADAISDFPSLGQELERTLRRLSAEGAASFAWLAGDLNPQGVVGDATRGTAEMGGRLVRHYGGVLAEVIQDAADFPLDRLPPSPTPAIDEAAAWDLVLGARGQRAGGSKRRVEVGTAPGLSLEIWSGGSWEAEGRITEGARDLLDLYVPLVAERDLVIGQLGQSLDGRIATESGASHYVTGPADIDRLHRLRALVDVVIVGASTVASDDPQLTVRRVAGEDPVRVVLDPSRRLSASHRVFSSSGTTLVVRGEDSAERDWVCEELRVPWAAPGALELPQLLEQLRARGLRRVLVEGGGRTVSGFLELGLLDRLHVTVAPVLIGSGRPSILLEPVVSLDEAIRPACRRFTLGEDVLFDLDLRAQHA